MRRFLLVFLCPLLWAFLIVGSKWASLHGENTLTLLFWGTLISMPFWWYRLWVGRSEIQRIPPRGWQVLGVIALIGTFLSPVFEALALKYWTASGYALLGRTSLLFTFLFAFLLLGERLERRKWPIVAILLVGTVLVVTNGIVPVLTLADCWTLAAAMSIALGNTVLGKILTKYVSPLTAAAAVSVAGFGPMILFVYFSEALHVPATPVFVVFWWLVGLLGTFARFVAYRHASAGYISMIYSFTPLIVVGVSYFVLSESISITQALGGMLVIGGGVVAAKMHT